MINTNSTSCVICDISKTFYLITINSNIVYLDIICYIFNVLIINGNKIYSSLKQTDN